MRRLLFSVLLLVGLATPSCDEAPPTSIPDVYVNFECSLLQSPYSQIRTPNEFIEITKSSKNIPVGYSGILIGQSPFNGYCAYDMCCPVERTRSVAVHIKIGALGIAKCNKCGEEYNLLNGAYPMKGISKEYLKKYNVSMSGEDLLFIHN